MFKKRSLACLMAIGFVALQTFAQSTQTFAEQANSQLKATADTASAKSQEIESDPVQVGFWFDVPGYTKNNKVKGFRFGFPFSGTSSVTGFDLSLFGSDVTRLDGAQMSIGFCSSSNESYGFQSAIFTCINEKHYDGGQLSLFNKSKIFKGWQIGGSNLSKDVDGSQVSIVNITEQLKGGQISLVTNVAEQVKGFQLSLVNVVTRNIGPQLGLINVAERSSFQLGLININKKSPMPFMILFNFSK